MSYLETKLKEWADAGFKISIGCIRGLWFASIRPGDKKYSWLHYTSHCESAQEAIYQLEQKMQEALKEDV